MGKFVMKISKAGPRFNLLAGNGQVPDGSAIHLREGGHIFLIAIIIYNQRVAKNKNGYMAMLLRDIRTLMYWK